VLSINQKKECVSKNAVFAIHKRTAFAFLLAPMQNDHAVQKCYVQKTAALDLQVHIPNSATFSNKMQQHLKTPAHTQIRAANNTTPARARTHATP
jgi:hypothetical protein